MSHGSTTRIIPVVLCVVAVAAVVAAGLLLFESRDQLTSNITEAETAFEAYDADSNTTTDTPVQSDLATLEWDEIDWNEIAADDDWEVLEPVDHELSDNEFHDEKSRAEDQTLSSSRPSGSRGARQRTGRLIVVTNFTRAQVTVNGESYPSYSEDGQNRGMELNANEKHQVHVIFDGNDRYYDIELRAGEERLLMVELTGMGQGSSASPSPRPSPRRERARSQRADDDDDSEGRITVYGRPRGTIYVGGENTGDRTPGTINVDPGRHEVRVEYEDGEMSETKTVRVREGSRIKLYFRQETDEDE